MIPIVPLIAHVTGGGIAIVSGWVAVTAAKGERLHRIAGTAFFGAMLLMATMAIYLAIALNQMSNLGAGIFALYLVATAWVAARRRDGEHGWFEVAALLAISTVAALFLYWGLLAAASPKGFGGYAPIFYYVFAGIAALFASLDLKVVLAHGLSGTARIARHLWRMCFAFFFASASFFIGQQKVMPQAWHHSPVLLALGLAPLAFLAFWMIRVQFWKGPETMPAQRGT